MSMDDEIGVVVEMVNRAHTILRVKFYGQPKKKKKSGLICSLKSDHNR